MKEVITISREKIIIRTGVIGIIANVFLSAFKAAVGLLSGSIAITLDAVNNLSDALSSVITIVSTKLAGRRPDKKHPYGHGRIEYLSAVTISVIVLYAGITSLIESIKKIIVPETPDYRAAALIIVAVAVVVKIVLGIYVRSTGEKVNSESLIASGKDALLDAVISASTLVAAIIFIIWGVSLEAWLGAVISLIIIKSGIDMLRGSISSILGERVESGLTNEIRETILSFPEVSGVFDLIVHNYGPEFLVASVHIEVPESMKVKELDLLERRISGKVFEETGVILAGISVYSRFAESGESKRIYDGIREIIGGFPCVLQLHGFSLDEDRRDVRFDLVMDYDEKNREDIFLEITEKIREAFPSYNICPTLDADITDI